jgi:putative membrane protein
VLKTLNPVEFPQDYAAKWGVLVNAVVAVLGAALIFVLYWTRI